MKKSKSDISRRNFFKTGAIIAGGVVVASSLSPIDGILFAAEPSKGNRRGNGTESGLISISASVAGNAQQPASLKTMYRWNPFIFVHGWSNIPSKTTVPSKLNHLTEELTDLHRQSLMKKYSNHFLFRRCAIIVTNRPAHRFARLEQHI